MGTKIPGWESGIKFSDGVEGKDTEFAPDAFRVPVADAVRVPKKWPEVDTQGVIGSDVQGTIGGHNDIVQVLSGVGGKRWPEVTVTHEDGTDVLYYGVDLGIKDRETGCIAHGHVGEDGKLVIDRFEYLNDTQNQGLVTKLPANQGL